jgi:hypothetical protein
MILGFKLSHRLVSAAGLHGESFSFRDTRYVGVRRSSPATLAAYFHRVLSQTTPTAIYAYQPGGRDRSSDALLQALETEAARLGISVHLLDRAEVMTAFGVMPLRTRDEVLEALLHIWPAVGEAVAPKQHCLAEAAAVALVGALREEWPPL